MRLRNLIVILSLFLSTVLYAENLNEVDKLLEKVNNESSPIKRKELIEMLKKKLAQQNKKAQEEADAIIKAKKKTPTKIYDESLL